MTIFRAMAAAVVLAAGAAQAQDTATGDGTVWEMSEAEREGFASAVGACWTVEPSFRMVTVTVRFSMNRQGRVIASNVELVEARGGDDQAQANAYEAVRTAILRCEGRGYDLPEEKYEIWREVDMTFDGRDGTPAG